MFEQVITKVFMALSATLAVGGLAFAITNSNQSTNKATCCNAGTCCPDGACCPDSPCCEGDSRNSVAKVSQKANCCPDGACCPTGPCCGVVKN